MKRFSLIIPLSGMLCVVNLASAQILEVSYPIGGGNISLTATGGDVNAAGLQFRSAGGNLIPAASAEPFHFLLSNTPTQITYGDLGTGVQFADGATTELSAGYSGPGGDDLTYTVGQKTQDPFEFPICITAGNPVSVRPSNGSTLDFGRVARSDVSAFRLIDAIKINACFQNLDPELTHFEITGATVFDIPDFEPVILIDGEPPAAFDLLLDANASPGHYEAELSIFGDFDWPDPLTYNLTAEIVPEPSSPSIVGLCWLILLTTHRLKASSRLFACCPALHIEVKFHEQMFEDAAAKKPMVRDAKK